jgi:hypothetical protein
MHEVGTLRHEAGHILDRVIAGDAGRFSYGKEWAEAKRLDSVVKRSSVKLPANWVLGNAERYSQLYGNEWGLEEDFADSIRFYSGKPAWRSFFEENYPNRYRILEGLLG